MTASLLSRHVLGTSPTSNLALLVHGRAGNSEVMWAFRRAVPEGWHVVTPQAPDADPIGGYSWWEMASPDANWRQQAELNADRLLGFLDEFVTGHQLRPRRIIGLGFSQGGALLSLATQRAPGRFDGVGLLASFVVTPLDPRTLSHPPEFFIAHGTEDSVIQVDRARRGATALREVGAVVEYHEEPVGHKIGSSSLKALGAWMTRFD